MNTTPNLFLFIHGASGLLYIDDIDTSSISLYYVSNTIGGGFTAGKSNDNLNFLLLLYYIYGNIEHNRLFVGNGVILAYYSLF